jgi:hypothetical protein
MPDSNSSDENVTKEEEKEHSTLLQIEQEFQHLSIGLKETSDSKVPLINIEPIETSKVKNTVYFLKDIYFNGKMSRFLMQNENGPCPLLAACKFIYKKSYLIIFLIF